MSISACRFALSDSGDVMSHLTAYRVSARVFRHLINSGKVSMHTAVLLYIFGVAGTGPHLTRRRLIIFRIRPTSSLSNRS
jgi:hypothetical protein